MKHILHMPAVTYAHSSESNTMCKLVTPKLFLIVIRLRLKTYDLHFTNVNLLHDVHCTSCDTIYTQ